MRTLEPVDECWGTSPVAIGATRVVHAGEATAAIGPNGARKTAWMRVKSAMIRPPSGTIKTQGVDVRAAVPDSTIELGTVKQAYLGV
jgi:ABC-type branched-subunit amino acid transport system ATPase component